MTNTEILTRVEAICKRGFTAASEITPELKATLIALSLRGPFIPTTTSGTIAADTQIITLPEDCGYLDIIVLDGLVLQEMPLQVVLDRADDGFAVRNNEAFICPVSASSRTYTLHYGKKHESTVSSIEFGDEFEETVVRGTAARVFVKYSIYDKGEAQNQLYENEIINHKKRLRIGE